VNQPIVFSLVFACILRSSWRTSSCRVPKQA